MKNKTDRPKVEAVLVRGQWVIECPFCGCIHRHGAGGAGDNPLDLLGHRNAHCDGRPNPGYILVASQRMAQGQPVLAVKAS